MSDNPNVAVLREWLDEYPAPNFTAERAALTAAIAALEAQATLSARDEAGAVACGACGKEWDGQKCGQAENGWPFPVCYPIATPPADRAPGEVDGDVIHAAVAYFNGLNTKASLHMAAEIEKCYAALSTIGESQ